LSLQPLRDTYATAVDVALAIHLDTPIEKLETVADLGSTIQCMGIAHIGMQGQPADERVYERVREVKRLYPNHVISVDGGVRKENARALVEAGAGRLVVGSALFEGDIEENFDAFIAATT
jgi:ribulose-phosphate 3-epimerase